MAKPFIAFVSPSRCRSDDLQKRDAYRFFSTIASGKKRLLLRLYLLVLGLSSG